MEIKCFNVVSMVISEATSQSQHELYENAFRTQILRDACKKIDMFTQQTDGVAFEAKIETDDSTDTKNIVISVVCPTFQLSDVKDILFDVLNMAKGVYLNTYDKDYLRVNFVFNGVWCNFPGVIYGGGANE